MINFKQFMEIQLLRQQGFSLREIASQLHISRNIVRKYLQQRSLPTYSSRKAKPSLLAAYQQYIQQHLQSALPHKLPATVIFREIQQQSTLFVADLYTVNKTTTAARACGSF